MVICAVITVMICCLLYFSALVLIVHLLAVPNKTISKGSLRSKNTIPEDYKNAGVLGVPNGSTMTPGEGLAWVDLGLSIRGLQGLSSPNLGARV